MLDLMLCCNDQHGCLDRLVAIEIGSRNGDVFMALDGDMEDGDSIEIANNHFTINGGVIPAILQKRHVGNIRWDLWRSNREMVSLLANYLRTLRHWSCPEASSPLFEKWRSKEPFTAADFESTDIPY